MPKMWTLSLIFIYLSSLFFLYKAHPHLPFPVPRRPNHLDLWLQRMCWRKKRRNHHFSKICCRVLLYKLHLKWRKIPHPAQWPLNHCPSVGSPKPPFQKDHQRQSKKRITAYGNYHFKIPTMTRHQFIHLQMTRTGHQLYPQKVMRKAKDPSLMQRTQSSQR